VTEGWTAFPALRTGYPTLAETTMLGQRRAPVAPGTTAHLVLLLAALALPVSGILAQGPGGRGGALPPGGGAFGGAGGEAPGGARVELVAQFDRDGDGVLDAAERGEAAEWLARNPQNRGGGMGRGGGYAPATAGVRLSPSEVASHAGTPLYDTGVVRTIFLAFDSPNWESELETFYNTDVQIPVTAMVDGVRYEDVGVRFRGMSSFRMVPAGSKRPVRLKFDMAHADQGVEGFRTLNLLNAMNDPTFVRTLLYSEIARAYIPAPRVGYLRLVVNGEDWGLYQNAQQFNRDFLIDHFGAAGGARWQVPGSPNGRGGMQYLGEDIERYRAIYEIDTRDDPEDWAQLIHLFRVLSETPLERLAAELDPILDIDGALRFLALEVALANSDGYWARASDYNLYLDPAGRFHILPHDMNEALGAGGGGGPGGGGAGAGAPGAGNVRLDPLVGLTDATKPLRSRLLAVPELQERYLGYVREIADQWLDWGWMGPRIAELQGVVGGIVAEDTRKLYTTAAFTSSVSDIQRFATERRAFLLERIPTR